jgi:Rrf2 family protein
LGIWRGREFAALEFLHLAVLAIALASWYYSYQVSRNYRMRFSLKSEYALRAALDLALHGSPAGLARTSDVARRTGAPAKFLEAVLGQLRRAGLVESERGSRGGHRLARPPSRIGAGDVVRAVEGPEALSVRPTPRRPAPGAATGSARVLHRLWTETERAVAASLDGVTLEDLARRVQESSGVPDFNI